MEGFGNGWEGCYEPAFSGFVGYSGRHASLSQRERIALFGCLPLPPKDQWNETRQGKCDDNKFQTTRIPASAPLKWRIEPHSEFVERQTYAKPIEQGDPRCGAIPPEDHCKIPGDGQ